MGETETTHSYRKPAQVAGIALALLAAGVVIAACSSSPKAAAAKPTCGGSASKLTVQGTGLASAKPDVLTISVGIDVTDPTAKAALADDNTKAASVIAALGFSGSAAKDVQTSDVTINPQYNVKGVITGYEVTNTLTAKLRNFGTAGSIVDAVAQAAGNSARLNSLAFSVEDTRSLENRARNDAVRQAVAHAKSMALAAGERLGPVCSLTDQSPTTFNDNLRSPFSDQSAAGVASSAIPLAPGSQQETAQVIMVYSLQPAPLHK